MAPLISVVMPAYNAEKFLEESISSILNQTFNNFEFIIVNDGSKDKTKKIINSYKKKDKRIILLNNPRNLGLQVSLNKALKNARGKYIARMDADDISLPKRFEIQVEFLEKNKDIFLVGGSAIVINEKGEKMGCLIKGDNARRIKKKLLKSNPLIHPSIMFRNSQEYYREKFVCSEDYDLYLRLLSKRKKIVNIPQFLVKYRISKNSFVSTMPYQDFYFSKAKEFYFQREKYNKDNYENLTPPSTPPNKIDFEKLNLRTKIIVKLQDNQMKDTRKEIKNYFTVYGFDKTFFLYYLLSLLPYSLIKIIRKL